VPTIDIAIVDGWWAGCALSTLQDSHAPTAPLIRFRVSGRSRSRFTVALAIALEIIPGCAHVPQLQSPTLFLEMIGDFLPATTSAPV
jgi:pimeloyl-ACP methyl ester carboxylesterase